MSLRRLTLRFALPFTLSLVGSPALAQQVLPDGTEIPLPLSQDLDCAICRDEVTNLPNPEESLSLQSLFEAYELDAEGEYVPGLDWREDAKTEPSVFSPLCGFTGQLVLRGGGCNIRFGWYNAKRDANGNWIQPTDDEIVPLIDTDDPIFDTEAFIPHVGSEDQHVPSSAAAIRNDPRYEGGEIGFAMVGDANEACKQTHYTQRDLNLECTAASCSSSEDKHWITSLIYQSVAIPNAFYIAFEDLPFSEERYDPPTRAPNGQDYSNDGDFNDFVYLVTGLECAGGGKPCEVPGKLGACSAGVTECAAPGEDPECRSQVREGPELCDNIDNDCNGEVDDGDLCPPTSGGAAQVCYQGQCVVECGSSEFPCNAGLTCDRDSGFCVDPACADIDCPIGQACRGGQCVEACGGVVCPAGQECQLGRCVDLCAGMECTEGPAGNRRVCEKGICVPACECSPCAEGAACATDGMNAGKCVPLGCEALACNEGQVCRTKPDSNPPMGECVDACEGVVCPGGATCMLGQCGEPVAGTGGSGGGVGGTTGSGGLFGSGGGTLPNSGGSGNADGVGGSAGNNGEVPGGADAGCACDLASSGRTLPFGRWSLLFGVGLGLAARLRRRRHA